VQKITFFSFTSLLQFRSDTVNQFKDIHA